MSHCDPMTLALVALGEPIVPDEDAHLQSCEQCLADAAELVEVVTVGRSAPVDLPPVPERVWAAITAELGLPGGRDWADGPSAPVRTLPPRATPDPEHASPALAPVVPLAPRRSRLWQVAGVAAAAGALLGGAVVWAAVDNGGAGRQSQQQLVAQAVLAPLVEDVAQSGQAEVMDSADGQVIRVDARALPVRDGFYEVWLIDTDVTKLVALGALPAGSVGTFTVPPGVSIEDFPVVDISLEPLDGDPAHSKESLMRGVLEA